MLFLHERLFKLLIGRKTAHAYLAACAGFSVHKIKRSKKMRIPHWSVGRRCVPPLIAATMIF